MFICFHHCICSYFVVPSITNASVCQGTISWSPPPCQANCTVIVNGQDIDTVPCSDGSVSISDTDLSNKIVMINATDELGNIVVLQVLSTEGTHIE